LKDAFSIDSKLSMSQWNEEDWGELLDDLEHIRNGLQRSDATSLIESSTPDNQDDSAAVRNLVPWLYRKVCDRIQVQKELAPLRVYLNSLACGERVTDIPYKEIQALG
jgi:hypothetical protein